MDRTTFRRKRYKSYSIGPVGFDVYRSKTSVCMDYGPRVSMELKKGKEA